ncbi:MAG TPA: ATP-binding protein [Terriglobales bacterium]|nr:ATP-binding protein [Terriglobales bacterium]
MTDSGNSQCEFEGKKLKVQLDITISAHTDSISPVVEAVLALAREMKCAVGKEFEIETAVREALANAIRHGCGDDSSKRVECCVACDEAHGMLIVVRDPGPGFDPAGIPSPIVGENIYSHHGRGIYLINQLMDEVRFERGGSEIHMRKT